MKSKIENKTNGGIGELLITLTIVSEQSVYMVVLSKVWEDFFQKKVIIRGPEPFLAKTIMERFL